MRESRLLEDFIEVYDNAANDSHCDQIIHHFEASQNAFWGRSGPGVTPKLGTAWA